MQEPKSQVADMFGPQGKAGQLLEHVSEKWSASIVYLLLEKSKRPSELRQNLDGISQKVLSQTLRKLELNGVILRSVHSVVPPKVVYSLTPHGLTLAKIFEELQNWASNNVEASGQSQVDEVRIKSKQLFERVAEKWTVKTVYVLAQGTKRYNELRREVEGTSQKMLTQTLRNLERDGLVQRVEYPVVPPHVEYSLTLPGKALAQRFEALCNWADKHYAEVLNSVS